MKGLVRHAQDIATAALQIPLLLLRALSKAVDMTVLIVFKLATPGPHSAQNSVSMVNCRTTVSDSICFAVVLL